MKLLTLNFLTCAIKTCKTNPASFPLHPRDAELEIQEAELNLAFLKNILPRLMWDEIRVIASEVRYIYILPYISTNPQHVAANKHVESLLI
jgi:multifunctional methyltransferase subunit TRM112